MSSKYSSSFDPASVNHYYHNEILDYQYRSDYIKNRSDYIKNNGSSSAFEDCRIVYKDECKGGCSDEAIRARRKQRQEFFEFLKDDVCTIL